MEQEPIDKAAILRRNLSKQIDSIQPDDEGKYRLPYIVVVTLLEIVYEDPKFLQHIQNKVVCELMGDEMRVPISADEGYTWLYYNDQANEPEDFIHEVANKLLNLAPSDEGLRLDLRPENPTTQTFINAFKSYFQISVRNEVLQQKRNAKPRAKATATYHESHPSSSIRELEDTIALRLELLKALLILKYNNERRFTAIIDYLLEVSVEETAKKLNTSPRAVYILRNRAKADLGAISKRMN